MHLALNTLLQNPNNSVIYLGNNNNLSLPIIFLKIRHQILLLKDLIKYSDPIGIVQRLLLVIFWRES